MSLAFSVAWRYLKRPTDRLISAVGFVSLLGLVIGVVALVISMALMTGYREDLQRKLLGGNAEIFVYAAESGQSRAAETIGTVLKVPGVEAASPVVFQHSLASSQTHATGEQAMLKGIEPQRTLTSDLLRRIAGPGKPFQTSDGAPGVAVGRYLAEKLALTTGSPITITVPTEENGRFVPRAGTYVVTHVFTTGFYEYDSRWIFISLDDAETLMQQPGAANLIEVKLAAGADLDDVVGRIAAATNHRFAVTDWRQMNRQLFSLLKIQQLVLFIVIGLIVFVSTFNIVSTLVMTVHEKRREIGILLSMGAERSLIRRIFLWYGTLVGATGTVAGVVIGVVASYLLTRFEIVSFGPEIAEVYFVSSIAFVTRVKDLAVISGFTLLVAFLATVLPSARAARTNPVEAIRHE